jgi:hypothetical protein
MACHRKLSIVSEGRRCVNRLVWLFVVLILGGRVAEAQTLRLVNGTGEPVVFTLVSGETTPSVRLSPGEYFDFELRPSEDERVLILRTASKQGNKLFDEGTRVLQAKTLRASAAPTKLIVAFYHPEANRSVLHCFCVGRGHLLPLQLDVQSAEELERIGKEYFRGNFTQKWETPKAY